MVCSVDNLRSRGVVTWLWYLIAMGTHGYTGVVLDHIGSVADYVIRHAPCPVLILRASRAGSGR